MKKQQIAGKVVSKSGMILAVAVNLGIIFYFKYMDFFIENVNAIAKTDWPLMHIVLPLGISFFTFQQISFIVDTYRAQVPDYDFLTYACYVTYFPQLIAGPIVTHDELIPQLLDESKKRIDWDSMARGFYMFAMGLGKKVLLADVFGITVSWGFEDVASLQATNAILVLLAYCFQLYFDFSGYSDMAIGLGQMMNIDLPVNFNSPYKALTITDFWNRWHMTLSRWLRDYLYIPLGGNRNATAGTYIIIVSVAVIGSFLSGSWWVAVAVLGIAAGIGLWAWLKPGDRKLITTNINSMNTMLLGGLWHGASWNFMIWGGLNGLGQVIYKVWTRRSMLAKTGIAGFFTLLVWALSVWTPAPVWNLFLVWLIIILAGTAVKTLYRWAAFGWEAVAVPPALTPKGIVIPPKLSPTAKWISNAWDIFQTFVFITFTRLFFRSGSNLDPALANEQAWNTAKNMVNQIGSHWDLGLIPAMVHQHRAVLILFVAGMLIHLLPERFKRRYRIAFSSLPLPVMALVVVLIVVFFFQFITADLQSFIYFQF